MLILTAAMKEYLIKRQIIFRCADSSLPQLYCVEF